MTVYRRWDSRFAAWALALILVACGGGGGGGGSTDAQSPAQSNTSNDSDVRLSQETGAPQVTGNTATDGLAWFNFRRRQVGLPEVARNSVLDRAAQNHSTYQQLNDTITHSEDPTKAGFTGATVGDRLAAAGYVFDQPRSAYGEVIAATVNPSGFDAAEALIGAIYHRFVIFEPVFKEVGGGSARVQDGYTYFTTNFAANGLGPGIGGGNLVVYPYAGQTGIPVNFFSDREAPDPVADRNEVGYPISVHANITESLTVGSFTVRPRGGDLLAVKLLSGASDADTPNSVASIVPLAVLAGGTVYDVQFNGSVGGASVSRSWSFTTR